jgi:predicted ATPase/DNA-binding CsgD family transcriptional regulator
MSVHNLPSPSTPFIGREGELFEITGLLSDPACRLLTLTGPGGIGKTRLALEAAFKIVNAFPNVVFFVPLQPLTSPDFIVTAIADALRFSFYGGGDLKSQLLDFLREKHLLLLLDNFEHLMDGVDLLPEILEAAPGVKLLVTSRERLRLREEWVFDVRGLSFPEIGHSAELESYSAAELFVQSARRVGYTPVDKDAASIVQICQMIEGIPLAIELAAAWVRAMPCAEIAREIEGSLDILATSTRNVPEKHRSMRAAFEHSWKLLTEHEQSVFRKLSVFRGGFTRAAAEQVAGASLPKLASLVDKSLVKVDANGRYDLQELLRQYAEEQLDQSPEASQHLRSLHAAYFADFMEQRWGQLTYRRQKEALAEIEADIENVRTAWRYSVQQHLASEIGKSIRSLWFVYDLRGWYYQGIDLCAQTVEVLRSVHPEEVVEAVLGQVLAVQGFWMGAIGFPEQGLSLAEEGLAILRRLNRREAMCLVLQGVFLNNWFLGRSAEATRAIQESLAIARETNDRWNIALALGGRYRFLDGASERPALEESARMFEELGDFWGTAIKYRELGVMAWELGEHEDANKYHQQSLKAAQAIQYRAGEFRGYYDLGRIAFSSHQYQEARYYYRLSLKTAHEVGLNREIPETLFEFARLQDVSGRKAGAVELLALVLHHPMLHFVKHEAQDLLSQLQTELPPDVYATAFEHGKTLELELVIARLLEEDSVLDPQNSSSERVRDANQSIADSLTEREREILRLLASGLSTREVAQQLFLTVGTVKWYLNQIYSKLSVHSRIQAIARARELKLLA